MYDKARLLNRDNVYSDGPLYPYHRQYSIVLTNERQPRDVPGQCKQNIEKCIQIIDEEFYMYHLCKL